MEDLDLDKLEQVARRATQCSWRQCGGYTPHYGAIHSDDGFIVYGMADSTVDTEHGKPIKAPDMDTQFANRVHIATFDPQTVLQLIAEYRATKELLVMAERELNYV